MSLLDRIDPLPPKRIYRWDLDKTYLQTDFDSLRQLVRTALQKATEKKAVPGAAALIRELKSRGDSRLCIVSGSPTQMRAVLSEKLKLDGVEFDELVLKDNVSNILRGRFKALRGQVGYKLPVLLESRARAPVDAEEVLFGDDAEADAFIYSLYADMVARRVNEPVVSRVVPIFNYFQAALVLMADGHLTATQVVKVSVEMIQTAGYNLLTLSNSFQDLLRRGLPMAEVASALTEALSGPQALLNSVRPVPDILAAFTKRIAALGATPAPAPVREIDYLSLIAESNPRNKGKKR